MNSAFKPVWFILAVILTLVGFGLVRGKMGPKEAVAWTSDYGGAFDQASQQKKPVLLYFTASWCPPCQQMKKTTFADASVAEALRDCVAVKVDVDENRQAAADHKVRSIPHMMLLSPDGKVIKTKGGYIPPDQFILWLKGT